MRLIEINPRAIQCLECPVSTSLSNDRAALLDAANAVLAHFMPTFSDSRAVDDCLVQLAAAVVKVGR